jgi:hypothetical protein
MPMQKILLIYVTFLGFLHSLTTIDSCRYKLPLTISDETGSIDTIAFSFVAEELVERSAYVTSQNMKIDPLDHVNELDTSIGKTKLFYIGMSGSTTSNFAIKYVLKKSYNVDASQITITVPQTKVISFFHILYTISAFHN